MNVYDFAPDLDLSKEGEGSIIGVKGIEGSDGIVYAVVIGVFFMIFIRIKVCYRVVIVDGDCFCRYEQAAIEGGEGGALG